MAQCEFFVMHFTVCQHLSAAETRLNDVIYCHRFHREQNDGEVVYDVLPDTVHIQTDALIMNLGRRGRKETLAVEIHFLSGDIFRMKIKPNESARQRYEIPAGDVLLSQPAPQR